MKDVVIRGCRLQIPIISGCILLVARFAWFYSSLKLKVVSATRNKICGNSGPRHGDP